MRRYGLYRMVLSAALLLAACGSLPEDAGGGPTPSASLGATGGGASGSLLPPGKPVVTVEGAKVTVTGLANGTSGTFPLSGLMLMTASYCASSNSTPFIWLYTSTNQGAGQFVDAETHLKNLKGEYYITIASNPDCLWTITFTPE